jgi:hypothetical protein
VECRVWCSVVYYIALQLVSCVNADGGPCATAVDSTWIEEFDREAGQARWEMGGTRCDAMRARQGRGRTHDLT